MSWWCVGESEAKLRQLFQEATQLAPCIVFIGTLFTSALSFLFGSPLLSLQHALALLALQPGSSRM